MKNENKDFTLEELQKMYKEASEQFHAIEKQLTQKKKDEEDRRKAELALAKETRKKEVEDAFDNYNKLLEAYIDDYDSYHTARKFNYPLNYFWKELL